jgi:hypothetical protein
MAVREDIIGAEAAVIRAADGRVLLARKRGTSAPGSNPPRPPLPRDHVLPVALRAASRCDRMPL